MKDAADAMQVSNNFAVTVALLFCRVCMSFLIGGLLFCAMRESMITFESKKIFLSIILEIIVQGAFMGAIGYYTYKTFLEQQDKGKVMNDFQ